MSVCFERGISLAAVSAPHAAPAEGKLDERQEDMLRVGTALRNIGWLRCGAGVSVELAGRSWQQALGSPALVCSRQPARVAGK